MRVTVVKFGCIPLPRGWPLQHAADEERDLAGQEAARRQEPEAGAA